MDQQTELSKVKARIRALAAKTVERGCSEAEAMAAAAKVGELLDVYGLSMSEVELREEACVQRRAAFAGPANAARRCTQASSRSSISDMERPYTSSSSPTLAAAAMASASEQPRSTVLAARARMRAFALLNSVC